MRFAVTDPFTFTFHVYRYRCVLGCLFWLLLPRLTCTCVLTVSRDWSFTCLPLPFRLHRLRLNVLFLRFTRLRCAPAFLLFCVTRYCLLQFPLRYRYLHRYRCVPRSARFTVCLRFLHAHRYRFRCVVLPPAFRYRYRYRYFSALPHRYRYYGTCDVVFLFLPLLPFYLRFVTRCYLRFYLVIRCSVPPLNSLFYVCSVPTRSDSLIYTLFCSCRLLPFDYVVDVITRLRLITTVVYRVTCTTAVTFTVLRITTFYLRYPYRTFLPRLRSAACVTAIVVPVYCLRFLPVVCYRSDFYRYGFCSTCTALPLPLRYRFRYRGYVLHACHVYQLHRVL